MSITDIIKAAPRKGQFASVAVTTIYSTTCLIQVKWIGAVAYARTANIVIPNAGGTVTFNYTGATADATIFTTGVATMNAAANDTVAEFVNLINNNANWRAFPVGALWSDSVNAQLALRAQTQLNTDEGMSICGDGSYTTNGLYSGLSFGITANRFMSGNKMRVDAPGYLGVNYQTGSYVNCLTYISELITFASAGYGMIHIWDCDDIAQTDTLIARLKPAATTTVGTFGNMTDAMLSVAPGHRMVVRVGNVNAALTAGDWANVISYSYNPAGMDLVP
jgi:hypothetical protein